VPANLARGEEREDGLQGILKVLRSQLVPENGFPGCNLWSRAVVLGHARASTHQGTEPALGDLQAFEHFCSMALCI